MNTLTPLQKKRVEQLARRMVDDSKRKMRAVKKWVETVKRTEALPIPLTLYIANNYTNPVTLKAPPRGVAIYMITDPRTGRKNYYDKTTILKLAHKNSNYALLMANRKTALFKNPVTRSNVYPRNVRRVVARTKKKTPSPKTAAKTIQKAVRKHLSKKKAKTVKKPSPPKKRQRETGRAGSQRVSK
jgi:hypothetical protein